MKKKSKKVTITIDRVYYKSATITVELPSYMSDEEVQEFITLDNEVDAKLEDALSEASLNEGETEYHYQLENGMGGSL